VLNKSVAGASERRSGELLEWLTYKMDRSRQQRRQQQHSVRHGDSAEAGGGGGVGGGANGADYPELHVVFEFFTDNPQKTMPVNANSPQKDSPYYDPYWDAIRSMQSNENFQEGILLRCVECNRKSSLSRYQCRSRSNAGFISCLISEKWWYSSPFWLAIYHFRIVASS